MDRQITSILVRPKDGEEYLLGAIDELGQKPREWFRRITEELGFYIKSEDALSFTMTTPNGCTISLGRIDVFDEGDDRLANELKKL